MIAPVASNNKASQDESMFAGLSINHNTEISPPQLVTNISVLKSFPVVPTAPVVIESNSTPSTANIANHSNVESFIHQPTAPTISTTAPPLENPFPNVKVPEPEVKEIRRKSTNFSALYAAEVKY